jgi:HSP20 family molecular chaperone IbpA
MGDEMSETNQGQPKQLFLSTLALLLFVVVCVQAWHMLSMEQQLETFKTQQHAPQTPIEDTTAQAIETIEPVEPVTIEDVAPKNQQPPIEDDQPEAQLQEEKDVFSNSPIYAQALDPYEDFRIMQQRMDKRFNEIYNRMYNRRGHMNRMPDRMSKRPDYEYHFSQRVSSPKIDIREDGNKYMVSVTIPGIDNDDISVNLEGRRLTIKAKQGYEKKVSDPSGNVAIRSRQSGRYQRSITLREPVDQDGMRTRINKGVLEIMIPKIKW